MQSIYTPILPHVYQCMPVYLYVCQSFYQCLSVNPSTSVCLSIFQPIYLYLYLFATDSVSLSILPPVSAVSVYLYVCQSFHLSISVCLSVCLSILPPVYQCLSVYLSICICTCLLILLVFSPNLLHYLITFVSFPSLFFQIPETRLIYENL